MIEKNVKKSQLFFTISKKYNKEDIFPNARRNIPTPGEFFHDLDFLQFQKKVVKMHDRKKVKKNQLFFTISKKIPKKEILSQYMEIISTPGNVFHDLNFLQFQKKVVKIHDRKK